MHWQLFNALRRWWEDRRSVEGEYVQQMRRLVTHEEFVERQRVKARFDRVRREMQET